MNDRPPCERDPRLFASPLLADHLVAREWCHSCPLAMFARCQKLAKAERSHDGTWAGVLYVDGKVSRKGRRWAKDGAR